ncbi:MAG: pyruvate, phosphate dikinase [Victivallales bacterium]|jgi:pyruvate, water dikinase|nr:pyruvate, phosphate dikinase [Victivallales bacterium]MBT7304109.1 pyruvate, phosphate dikinase [Victivallales bacterium]
MPKRSMRLSTGLPDLDRVFRGIMPGDNIVWQIDSIADYQEFVTPYMEHARLNRQRMVYFRFANHEPLMDESSGAQICELHPEEGFEAFIMEIHRTINEEGRATLFVFDCLSTLAPDWNSDRMLGNFFMLTCPHLYDRAAIAYFAIFRNYHSHHAVRPISNTTQILVDAYRRNGQVYIHPKKVQYRHSSSMYMLHVRQGSEFVPVTQSAVITDTLADVTWSRSDPANYLLGYWSRTFAEAETLQQDIDRGVDRRQEAGSCFRRLLRMLISREERVLALAESYLDLPEILAIRRRMIGTGLIGGKAAGMVLARAILTKSDTQWGSLLEKHDSFFVGADVFYTYLVQNHCWWMMQQHKGGRQHEDETETARRRILAGEFPEYIVTQFADMLDYFGQSPIIVRSSSLMEDNFGNAFAGKYESVFCANQGGQHKRLEDFLCAVRVVYASTMCEEALEYRSKRGLLGRDEQMGLLIQRVSGATYGSLFFPQAAGVAFSFNPYVWNSRIDPEAGMLRIVFGVGTRAVDRSDDDYTRVVALNAPLCRPESSRDEVRQYAQRRVDVLDLDANQLTPTSFEEVVKRCPGIPLEMFASRDMELERRLRHERFAQNGVFSQVLTFDHLLTKTNFVADMRQMLEILKTAYDYPVDVEWTLNALDETTYKINVVQCRPFQVRQSGDVVVMPADIPSERVLIETRGPVIGKSLRTSLDYVIYVCPGVYGELPVGDRYEVARIIGEVIHLPELIDLRQMLVGPGRWGTTTPSLGVPATFAEIRPVSVLCELVMMRENLIPDVSLGTHFFNEMVENDMLYLALFPQRDGSVLNRQFLEEVWPNRLGDVLPAAAEWSHAIRVLDARDLTDGAPLLSANVLDQHVVCWRAPETGLQVGEDGL